MLSSWHRRFNLKMLDFSRRSRLSAEGGWILTSKASSTSIPSRTRVWPSGMGPRVSAGRQQVVPERSSTATVIVALWRRNQGRNRNWNRESPDSPDEIPPHFLSTAVHPTAAPAGFHANTHCTAVCQFCCCIPTGQRQVMVRPMAGGVRALSLLLLWLVLAFAAQDSPLGVASTR